MGADAYITLDSHGDVLKAALGENANAEVQSQGLKQIILPE